MRIRKGLLLFIITAGILLATGCVRVSIYSEDEIITYRPSVDSEGAESVRVDIDMGVGELKMSGGAEKLMEGEILYSDENWKPEVTYRKNGERGRLIVEQPSLLNGISIGNLRYEWDLRFSNDIPMDLRIKLGAGSSKLYLGDLTIEELEIGMGVGESTVDLTGTWERDLHAYIKGGVGRGVFILPENTGVRVKAKGGLGSISARGFKKEDGYYVNDAYGHTDATLELEIEGGIGEIELRFGD